MSIQLKRGATSTIRSSQTELLEGQPLVDLSTNKLYIGETGKKVNSLAPWNVTPAELTAAKQDLQSGINGEAIARSTADAKEKEAREEAVKDINDKISAYSLQPSKGTNSLGQRYLDDEASDPKYKYSLAYQHSSTALGGGNQAGMTQEEFNNYYWDSVEDKSKNGGTKDADGTIRDFTGRKYDDSRSFAFTAGSGNKSLGRNSITLGTLNTNEGLQCHALGVGLKITDKSKNATYVGKYNAEDFDGLPSGQDVVFGVGTGNSDTARKTSFAVTSTGFAIASMTLDARTTPVKKHVVNVDMLHDYAVDKNPTGRDDTTFTYAFSNGKSTTLSYGCSPATKDGAVQGANLVQFDSKGSFYAYPVEDTANRVYTYGQAQALKNSIQESYALKTDVATAIDLVKAEAAADATSKDNTLTNTFNTKISGLHTKSLVPVVFTFDWKMSEGATVSLKIYGRVPFALYSAIPRTAISATWVAQNLSLLQTMIGSIAVVADSAVGFVTAVSEATALGGISITVAALADYKSTTGTAYAMQDQGLIYPNYDYWNPTI